MKYFEFGTENPECMVLLHGGGTSYRGMLPTAKEMAKAYHVVLVAYDGFNPDEPETEYRSPMNEAKRLGDYIVERFGGKIDILYGISYGCRVLMEVLADERLKLRRPLPTECLSAIIRISRVNGERMSIAFSSPDCFTQSWDIRGPEGKSSWRRFRDGRRRKRIGSCTARRPGGAGGIGITI